MNIALSLFPKTSCSTPRGEPHTGMYECGTPRAVQHEGTGDHEDQHVLAGSDFIGSLRHIF